MKSAALPRLHQQAEALMRPPNSHGKPPFRPKHDWTATAATAQAKHGREKLEAFSGNTGSGRLESPPWGSAGNTFETNLAQLGGA